jgi:hypothetical protein
MSILPPTIPSTIQLTNKNKNAIRKEVQDLFADDSTSNGGDRLSFEPTLKGG